MAKNSGEGLIQHLVGVRYRLEGSGNFRTIIRNLGTGFQELSVTPMLATTGILPLRLANFRSQGMQVEFRVSEIDETFSLMRIIVYTKPSATGYPQ